MSESIVISSRTLEDILWWLNMVERASGAAHAAIDRMVTPLTVEQKIEHDNAIGTVVGTAEAAVRGIKNALLDAELMEDSPTLAEVNARRGWA